MSNLLILTTIYNCEAYVSKCINSIKSQNENFKCVLLDDMSTDNSILIAEELTKNDDRFKIIKNKRKMYQPGNYDQVLRSPEVDDTTIVVEVDGDDWLHDQNSLRIVKSYHDKGYWITHGSFVYSDGRQGFSKRFDVESLRVTRNNATHLRSWRAGLWKKINKNDLMINNWYAPTAGDVFFMLPMLEMAGNDRIKHIEEILYVYNEENPINDHKVDLMKQLTIADFARRNKIYSKLP